MHPHKKKMLAIFIAIALVIALALIASPELRALLLLTDSLGLDLLALLFATQLRYFVRALIPAASTAGRVICGFAFYVGNGAMRTLPKALPWRPFDKLLCPALVLVSYGMRCGLPSVSK
jgi:hypothetical protein